ncbi:hypothetical protein JTE90_008447 [Oedothorax gibbosus]|uniref:Uncharacterized protein n=1 Tax=Oedothorax gibbosus TaxID=931172 RepID=A0AAV6UWA4_9ARAC|nr:hypothetical protein JTE90_008447 [Oedothorax gibbosus]
MPRKSKTKSTVCVVTTWWGNNNLYLFPLTSLTLLEDISQGHPLPRDYFITDKKGAFHFMREQVEKQGCCSPEC